MQALPALQGLNTALKAGGSILKGVAGLRAGQYNKSVYAEQAREEAIAGNAQALMLRDQARAAIGEQLGGQWANGFEGGSGSALDALAQSQVNMTLDMMELRRAGAMKSRALLAKGDQAASEGHMALAQGLIGAVSDISSHGQDWAAAKAGQSLPSRKSRASGGITVTHGGGFEF